MKMNRKGFTLIELLVTIVIVGLVIGFSVFGIVKLIKNSEDKVTVLTENNLKEAARIYSTEMGDDSWKKNTDFDAFCVTVGELMNKGLLDKNAVTPNGINRDSYIIVKRNNVTLAVEQEEMVSDTIGEEYNTICTGQNIQNENITKPSIGTSVSYTDRIDIPFSAGSAESGIKNYKCLYGTSSSSINREGIVEGNTCVLDGLKNNTPYYVFIYMITNNGSSVLANGNREYSTKDFKDIGVTQNKNIVTINYDDANVQGPIHYFHSNINSTSNKAVNKCTVNNNKFTCGESVTSIEKDTWYQVSGNVTLTYPEENNSVKVTSRIYDKSNNYKEFIDDITIRKYTIKFYRNGALNIDGSTSDYIEKYCIEGGTNKCSITSPGITAQTGFTVVGWNTSSSATTSSWNIGTSKQINSDLSYYAIARVNKIYIKYNTNGGKIATSSNSAGTWTADSNGTISLNGKSSYMSINYGAQLGKDGLNNWNNSNYLNISKIGHSATSKAEWKCLSGNCSKTTYDQSIQYNASDFCDASSGDCTVEIGVNWKVNSYTYNIVYKSSSGVQLGTDTITKDYGTTNTVSPKSFTGYTSPTSQSVKWDSTSAKTITFTYTPIEYTISYTLNGGSVSSSNKTKYTIETATFTLNNPTKTGYTFTGWTGSNGTTASTSVSISKGSTGNKSYTANWSINSYYFDLNWVIDGTKDTSVNTTKLQAGLKIGGVDKGYNTDYYTEHPYGTTWEIYGLKLNGTNVSYSKSGTIGASLTSVNVKVNTLSISVNDSSYGSVSSSSLYVLPETTYKTSGNTLTLSDGRTITASVTNATGYTTSFSSWSPASGTINSATSVTANFSRTTDEITLYVSDVIETSMNCRGSASTNSAIEATYSCGQEVKGSYYNDDWFYFKNGGNDGCYLWAEYLSSERSCTYYVTSGINCRSGPATDFDIVIGYANNPCGTKFIGYPSTTIGWTYYPGKTCYMTSEYLSSTPVSCGSSSTCSTCTSSCPYGGTLNYVGGAYNGYYCELTTAVVASSSYGVGDLITRYNDCMTYLNEIGKSGFSRSDQDGMYLGECNYKAS